MISGPLSYRIFRETGPLTLFSPARVQPLYGAGRKESPGTGLYNTVTANAAHAFQCKGSAHSQQGDIVFKFLGECLSNVWAIFWTETR